MYLNEGFDYLGFLGYRSRCWQILLVGRGESRTLKQRVKKTDPLIDTGGGGWGGALMPTAQRQSAPTPDCVFQLSGDSGILAELQFHNPLPSIPFQLLEGCLSLMQMRPALRLWLQKREEGAEGSSEVTGLVESWISSLKKMHWAPMQQCFAAVTWSVVYFSEWRFYSVCAVVV